MREPGSGADDGRTERVDSLEQASLDRTHYRELLEELRTVIPGVQVLLAFLLTAPFSARFSAVSRLGHVLYGVAVCCAALATILLMSPASYHRLTRRTGDAGVHRRRRLRYSERTTVVGLLLLLVAIVAAILLVTTFVFELPVGAAMAAVVAAVGVAVWYVVPLVRRFSG